MHLFFNHFPPFYTVFFYCALSNNVHLFVIIMMYETLLITVVHILFYFWRSQQQVIVATSVNNSGRVGRKLISQRRCKAKDFVPVPTWHTVYVVSGVRPDIFMTIRHLGGVIGILSANCPCPPRAVQHLGGVVGNLSAIVLPEHFLLSILWGCLTSEMCH